MLALTGRLISLVTPFTDDGSAISEVRLVRLLRHLSDAPGFAVATEAGEFTSLAISERKQLAEWTLRESGGKPVVVHATCLGTAQTLDLCQHASRHGARAAAVMPPYFGTYSDEELISHLRQIGRYAGLPILICDPQRLLGSEVTDALATMSELTLCNGPSWRFSAGALSSGLGLAELDDLGRRFAPESVAKAWFESQDVEVGQPRSPRAPLSDEGRAQLRSVG